MASDASLAALHAAQELRSSSLQALCGHSRPEKLPQKRIHDAGRGKKRTLHTFEGHCTSKNGASPELTLIKVPVLEPSEQDSRFFTVQLQLLAPAKACPQLNTPSQSFLETGHDVKVPVSSER